MKKIISALIVGACMLCICDRIYAQSDIKIGETTIRLQSPVKIEKEKKKTYRNLSFPAVFGGFSFPVAGCNYESTAQMPVEYGNSFEITLGVREWFPLAKHYYFGVSVQYTHYDYRADGILSDDVIQTGYPSDLDIYREVYKTDNFGIGVYNRITIGGVYLDLGAYGDWAFSRQYKVLYYSGDSKEHYNYRDGGKFLPLQGGVYAALGYDVFSVYCRYRFTNLFSHSELPIEPPRLSIGMIIEL